jgi:hypothetical protein
MFRFPNQDHTMIEIAPNSMSGVRMSVVASVIFKPIEGFRYYRGLPDGIGK